LLRVALTGLRQRVLVADDGGVTLTPKGRAAYKKLVEIRSARLNELLTGWQPEQEAELRGSWTASAGTW
jgi:hypothetical protein